jgi:integrase
MPVRPRAGGYQADLTHKGVRYREQFASEQEALQWEADTRAALIAGRPLPKATSTTAATTTLGQLRDMTAKQFWKGRRSEEDATRAADQAVAHFGANTLVSGIKPHQITEWADKLGDSGLSNGTVNRKLAALSKMLHHAQTQGIIATVPYIARRKEGKARDRFLTVEETEKIMACLRHWGRADFADLTVFLLDTGARLGEALALRVRDVGGDRVMLGAEQSKNDESRVVPLTRRLRDLLPSIIAGRPGDELVFATVNRSTFKKTYSRVAKEYLKLGDDVCVHTLRHTCASWLVTRGVDLRRVKEWMGHKDIATTLRYAKLAPEALFDAVTVLDDPSARPKPKLKVVGETA